MCLIYQEGWKVTPETQLRFRQMCSFSLQSMGLRRTQAPTHYKSALTGGWESSGMSEFLYLTISRPNQLSL